MKLVNLITLNMTALALTFSGSALASDSLSASEVNMSPATKKAHPSSENRNAKKISIGTRAGLLHTFIPGVGVEAGYMILPNVQVGLTASRSRLNGGNDEYESTRDDGRLSDLDLETQSFGAQARWFAGNSFYIVGGLSNRIVNAKTTMTQYSDSNNYVTSSADGNAWCLDAGVGNQWSFASGFYLGAEWFGISQPLSSHTSRQASIGGTLSDAMRKSSDDNDKFVDSLTKGPTFRIGMLTAGWNF